VNKFTEETRIRQVDEGLAIWRKASLPRRPPQGWIKTIRMALGMTSGVLAQRVGDVSDSAIRKLEIAEAEDAITLASLRRVAEALDCELQYALIPRLPLKQMLSEQASIVAGKQMERVSHTMALEDQKVRDSVTRAQKKLLMESLLAGSKRRLW
jgi:predicted DNA-binding mobile mystery protein A